MQSAVHVGISTGHLWGTALFALTAGAWFTYFRVKERGSKPFVWMLAALVGGNLSALLSVVLYNQLEALGFPTDWRVMQESWVHGIPMSLVIGVVEESSKLLPVLLLAIFSRHFKDPLDGLFLAACAGVGFAAAENVMFSAQGLSLVEGLARAAATPVTHALFAAPWGLGLGTMLVRGRKLEFVGGFAVSVSAHGLYDLLLARPHVPQVAAAFVVLSLWVWLLARTAPRVIQKVRESGLRPSLQLARASGSFAARSEPSLWR